MKLARCAALAFVLLAAACGRQASTWHGTDVTGAMPALDFTLTRANDGAAVRAADYRGKVAILYFGYTHCPDICPTTLANLAEVLQKLGARAGEVRVLFVTVDPGRDTPAAMAGYVRSFAPQIDGLRGTPDELTALTRRYRVAFSVTPAGAGQPYDVMHSNAVFFFDKKGRARLVATATDDVAGVTADVKRLLD
ncbi:MAG TPA: SCO family protein [Rhizomicrobium sp.]|jgi:protein SCO1/2|nr:SCO family protein [Rhizomicrobium sp.]